MKVLMINSVCGYGSTGSICVDIATVLEKQGHECYIAYGQGTTTFKNSFKIGTILENHLHNVGSRVTGKQGYFTKNGTHKLIAYIKSINPDVIHLHNLHGNYLNLELLFNYMAEIDKPVVWTLHDCWAFTGKCAHYTDVACYKWQSHCHHCPQVDKYPPSLFFDRSEVMYTDKKKWFNSVKNLTIVPVSNWLADEVKKSFLNKNSIKPVYNWVNHDVFIARNEDIREQYGIPKNKFIILGVSAGWNISSNKLKDFICLSTLISDDMQIVLVGKADNQNDIPSSIIHISYVDGANELSKIYSIADVYVHLSTEDTFGKVIAEAMSCGTPVIVYNATACPEIVGDGYGYIVEKNNVNKVYEKIQIINENGKEMYSLASRNHVIKFFDMDNNINKIIKIYKYIIVE
jgi:putative colanic acid biosynthesis glycosyltransferase